MSHPVSDLHFKSFTKLLEATLLGYGTTDEDFTAKQKRQVETLVALEKEFRDVLIKHGLGVEVYQEFVKYVMDTRRNLLCARPFFRERQETFKTLISPILRERDEKALYRFDINYRFILFALKVRKFKKNTNVLKLAKKVERARRELIEQNMPLAISRAKIFKRCTPASHLEYMDLIQASNEGLIAAVDKFVLPYRPVFRSVIIGRIVGNLIEDYCVDPKTKVLTSGLKWVQADTLKVGDELIGFDENSAGDNRRRKYRNATVTGAGSRDLHKLKITTDQAVVTVSDEHLFLCVGGRGAERLQSLRARSESPEQKGLGHRWVRADQLRVGDEILFLCKPWKTGTSYDHGYLKGMADGEGCISGDAVITIAQLPGVVFDEIGVALKSLNFMPYELKQHNKSGVKNWCIGGIAEVLRFLGEVRPSRLLKKSERAYLDRAIVSNTKSNKEERPNCVTVTAIEDVGVGPVVTLQTTTGTLITEGLLSHNSETLLHFFPDDRRKLYKAHKARGRRSDLTSSEIAARVNFDADASLQTTSGEIHSLMSAASTVSYDAPLPESAMEDGEHENAIDRYAADPATRPDVLVEEFHARAALYGAINNLTLLEMKMLKLKGVTP